MRESLGLLVVLGAALLGGCGSSNQAASSPDVPSAVETTPASPIGPEARPEAAGSAAPAASAAPTAKP